MPETNIAGAIASDLTNVMTDYSVNAIQTDAAGDQKEFTWQSTLWTKNLGYYKKIPELKTSVDTKATWVIGAGIEADEQTIMLLDKIKGNGKDTFTSILKNQYKIAKLDGDSYAEIIRDDEKLFANLKPLAPDSIVSVQNQKGQFIRYEQVSKIAGKKNKIFQPDEIFHLSNERIADEIHGVSVVQAVEWI
ncbi:hypothetical protein LCGC14_2826300, partial [marine sediment metagenome]